MSTDAKTLVIGASAAGLATAACLRQAGLPFEMLEAATVVGAPWHRHYDRLHLHTPRSGSALPGLPMPRDWPRYPAREHVVQYFESYRHHHRLEPHLGQQVLSLVRDGGSWVATTSDRQWRAANVIVATGATRRPVRPSWPGLDGFDGPVLHSAEYRNGRAWRGKSVLVVGFGNSACELAMDLLEHGALPTLSVRSAVNVIPRDVAGVLPILQLGIALRRLPTGVADALARPVVRLAMGDIRDVGLRKLGYGPMTQIRRDRHTPLLDFGTMAHIRAGRIAIRGEIEHFTPDSVTFTDGTDLRVGAVLLATGYRPALEEFLPEFSRVCDTEGLPTVSGGPTALDGLYFCGQFISPSGMLREIALEADRLARHLAAQAR